MDTWTISALDTGTSLIDKSIITYLVDGGTLISIPRVMWYLEGSKRIVVDTSAESEYVATEVMGENLTRRPEQVPSMALKQIGVKPTDIDYVIFTHLHWDHCGNNDMFHNAKFIVQKDEISYANSPGSFFERSFLSSKGGFIPPYHGIKFDTVDGDVEILPGLQLLKCPGHTPGSQALRIKTIRGWHTISGDAVYTYENLEKGIPPGFHVNVDESMESMKKIVDCSDVVLPSHDYKLFTSQGCVRFGD